MSYRKVYEDLAVRNMKHVRGGTVGAQFHEPGNWDVWHIPTILHTYPLAALMLKGLGYEEFDICLDIGCGTVKFEDSFTAIGKSYLFDIAWPYCEFMSAIQADIEAMPIPDDFADLVVCSDILEHVLNYEQAMSEVRRILKDGGVLLAAVPNDAPVNDTHLRRFTRKSRFEGFDILDMQVTEKHGSWLQELVIVMKKE